MKNTSTCPKCGSTEVIMTKGNKMNPTQKIDLDKWGLKSVGLDRYLCVRCGYTEEWVQIDDKFDRWVTKNWQKLQSDDGFV